jgi:16S rRNA (cytidine1402-2'-O)-methyltransferase
VLRQLAMEERTMVFYESPLRLVKTMTEMMAHFGEDRNCCVSRELTKVYEENRRGSLKAVCEHFREQGVKGVVVLVVEGAPGRRRVEVEEGGEEEAEGGEGGRGDWGGPADDV